MPRLILLSLFTVYALGTSAQSAVVRTFDDDAVGALPRGFTAAAGREAAPGRWAVQRETGNQMLTYLGVPDSAEGFAVAIHEGSQYEDVRVSVRLKATGGSRSAGLVWKYQDPMNHYAVRLDLASQTLEVYRVVRGNRIRVEHEDDLELDPDAWHTLRIVQDDDVVRAYLGGVRVFSERSRALPGPGGVGLWVAGNAVASFDDLRIEPDKGGKR